MCKLRVHALGNTTKVGCSSFAYELIHGGNRREIILVDLGIDPTKLPIDEDDPDTLNANALPDLEWLKANWQDVKAIFFTHCHLDHIGAVKYYFSFLERGVPIYASTFTASMIRRELRDEHFFSPEKIDQLAKSVNINEIKYDFAELGQEIVIGGFRIVPFFVSHSTPESNGFLVQARGQAGEITNVVHLADFKFNGLSHFPKMVVHRTLDRLSKFSIDWVVIESLYSRFDGFTPQENLVFEALFDLIMELPHSARVIVSHFASNVARMRDVIAIAQHTGRSFAMHGRAMKDLYLLAKQHGYLEPQVYSAFEQNAEFLLVTGSQGEPYSVLSRAARGRGKPLVIDENDVVIFSSDVIPGNEQDFIDMVKALVKRGATVYTDERSYFPEAFAGLKVYARRNLHVSGHGTWTDKKLALKLLSPRQGAIPMHGDEHDERAFHDKAKEELGGLKTMSFLGGSIDLV
ncbi:MAG: MBL fold metallo-hydrolase [Patescibacteria group bacterium]